MKKLLMCVLSAVIMLSACALTAGCGSSKKTSEKQSTDVESGSGGGDVKDQTEVGMDYDVENWSKAEGDNG